MLNKVRVLENRIQTMSNQVSRLLDEEQLGTVRLYSSKRTCSNISNV